MFVAQDVVLDVGFTAARLRLLDLISGCGLDGASRAAYDDGLASIVRTDPFDKIAGPTRLISVRFLEPSERDDRVTAALRWEATGGTGDPVPVLDADLALSPAGAAGTRLALSGIYRPPSGRPGAVIDPVVMHRVANATVRVLLDTVAGLLTRPDPRPSRNHTGAATCCGPRPPSPARRDAG
jgi:hypothetical protein